jgi:hypothetical protein
MSECEHPKWRTFNGGKFCRCAKCDADPAEILIAAQSEIEALRQQISEILGAERKFAVNFGKAYVLHKQAEAVEALRDSIKEQYPLEPFGDLDEYVIAGMKEVYTYVEKSAKRLRQQADEAERAGGEK